MKRVRRIIKQTIKETVDFHITNIAKDFLRELCGTGTVNKRQKELIKHIAKSFSECDETVNTYIDIITEQCGDITLLSDEEIREMTKSLEYNFIFKENNGEIARMILRKLLYLR